MKTIARSFTLAFAALALHAQPPGGGGPGGGSGDGIWQRNAAFGEKETFDLCNGHQPGSGQYHHHINPICLRAQLNDNVAAVSTGRLGTAYAEKTAGWTHSPILGWSFDGYPVYGPYGYSDPTNPNSPIKRMASSFQLRSITQRHTLPTWILPYLPNYSQNLTASQYGPDVSAANPLGRYVDDYDYVAGSGDLDPYNGRYTVTPDYPGGTYAYFVTLDSSGAPAFPYIINVQYYGSKAGGGTANSVAADAVDYFTSGGLAQTASTNPELSTWYTKGSSQNAQAISGTDPSAGPSTTWPLSAPAAYNYSGGNKTAALADVQRIRYDASTVYVNSNDLPSYVFGPWFEATMTGGVFMNWPSAQNMQVSFPRTPAPATTKASSGMGPVGIWVNGVAIFNVLDGASYSNAAGADQGGGGVSPRATHVSAASGERGPLAQGSLVTAYPEFNATFPQGIGDATVTVTDSSGAQLPASILYASPGQVNYQMPVAAATGFGRVTISTGGISVSGTVNIVATYPGIFTSTADGQAAGQIVTGSGSTYLVLYGTGIGSAPVTATVGGVNATVTYSGPQGTYPGLDQVNLLLPPSLAGKGKINVALTAGGKAANPVYVVVQ